MPCIKCNNGKWKYGEHGKCVFDTLAACKKAAAAIHIQNPSKSLPEEFTPCTGTCEDCTAELAAQYK